MPFCHTFCFSSCFCFAFLFRTHKARRSFVWIFFVIVIVLRQLWLKKVVNSLKFAFNMETAIGQMMMAPWSHVSRDWKRVKMDAGGNCVHFLPIFYLPVCKAVGIVFMYISEGCCVLIIKVIKLTELTFCYLRQINANFKRAHYIHR